MYGDWGLYIPTQNLQKIRFLEEMGQKYLNWKEKTKSISFFKVKEINFGETVKLPKDYKRRIWKFASGVVEDGRN